jgi:1-acyl-sn-glycerol-3-phosphate acyltransferase
VNRPSWLRVRVAAGYVVVVAAAAAIDLALRFGVLPFTRAGSAARIGAFNRATRAWGRILFGAARWAVGLEVVVEGRVPDSGRYLIVANHQSSLDIPFLITTFSRLNLKFVAMEALRRGKPVISIVLRHGGSVTVGKTNVGEDLAALTRFAGEVERYDGSPLIFPGGGLERGEGARRFHLAGIEVLRRGSRLPILPVAIDGMAAAPTIGGLLRLAGARVTMRIGDPVPFDEADRNPRAAYDALERWINGGEGGVP